MNINFRKSVKKKYLTPALCSCMITRVVKMEKIVRQGILYDFYGELLTEHQRQIYEEVVFHDLSLSEIAQEQGISRQGVHDLVRRCDKILQGYEDKLHLVEKFQITKDLAGEIRAFLDDYQECKDPSLLARAKDVAEKIAQV